MTVPQTVGANIIAYIVPPEERTRGYNVRLNRNCILLYQYGKPKSVRDRGSRSEQLRVVRTVLCQ